MEALVLTKGETLSLKKEDGSNVSKIRVGISYDPADANAPAMDLDLVVHHKESRKTAYFGNKTAIEGVQLSDDNRTGEGEGDDEFAKLDATKTADGKYVVFVNIYNAEAKGQNFGQTKNAKATVYNDETGAVIATFPITENGGENTALIIADVTDSGDNYVFKARGDFLKGDINQVIASI